MDSVFIIVLALVFFVVFILAMRLLGAWMLRINTVINNQQQMIMELKKMNDNNISQQ